MNPNADEYVPRFVFPPPQRPPDPMTLQGERIEAEIAARELGGEPIYFDNNGIRYIPRYDAWGNAIRNNDGRPMRTSGDINWNSEENRARLRRDTTAGRSSKKRKSRKMRKKRKSRKMRKKKGKRKSRIFRKK